jgi:hypothetical protein
MLDVRIINKKTYININMNGNINIDKLILSAMIIWVRSTLPDIVTYYINGITMFKFSIFKKL